MVLIASVPDLFTFRIKNVDIERPYLAKGNVLWYIAAKDEKHFVMGCVSLSVYRNTFLRNKYELLHNFSVKTVD